MKKVVLFIVACLLIVSLSAQNVEFTVYNQANTPAFTTNSFRQVVVGKWKHVWVGTANSGIYKFNGNTWVKGTVLMNNLVKSMVRGKDSSIIFGQAGYNAVNANTGGVNIFQDTTFSQTYYGSLTNGLHSRYVNGICVSNNGRRWAGNGQDLTAGITKEGGLSYLAPGASSFVKITAGMPSSDIRILALGCSGTQIWASIDRACPPGGCIDAGILIYDENGAYLGKWGPTNTPIPFITSGSVVRAIGFTKTNDAWVGLNTGGVAVLKGGIWTLLTSANSRFPSGASVNYNSIIADGAGRVYIGTSAGLLVYRGGPLTDTNSYTLYTTANGLPSNNVTGIEVFSTKIKWLTTANGVVKMTEDYFKPNPDGWSFDNADNNIWPISWYGQFVYTHDPYLGGASPFPKITYVGGVVDTIWRGFFPDWPLFVEVVGETQCYTNVAGVKTLRPKAFAKYKTQLDTWGGSCFGFVQSSFMAWDSLAQFKARFPDVGPWPPSNQTYDLPINNGNRRCINHLMQKQSLKPYYRYKATQANVTPLQTLNNLRTMFADGSRNDRGLIIRNQNPGGGGHIVNPYKIRHDGANPQQYIIYVYDNNWPNDTTRKIIVDTVQNCWWYNLAVNAAAAPQEWGGPHAVKGLFLSWPARDWYNPIALDSVAKNPEIDYINPTDEIELYNSQQCDILVSNAAGQSIGYQGDMIVWNMPDAMPMIRETGRKEVPKGYHLPVDDYSITMKSFKNALSEMSFFNPDYNFEYLRTGATLTQKDQFSIFYDGFLVNNTDSQSKTIKMTTVFDNAGNEMSVEISKLGNSVGGIAGLSIVSPTEVKLLNMGAATTYNLNIRYLSSNEESKFKYDSISIAANTAHIIHPDWVNLKTALMEVYVDNNNNSSYEDTLYLGNLEPPQILTWPTSIKFSSASSVDTIHVINNGGGSLSWQAVSSDTSWLKISGTNTGVNNGSIVLLASADTAGSRNATITLTSVGAGNNNYTIQVRQEGVVNTVSSVNASDGEYYDGIHVSWSAVSGAQRYQVYRADNAGTGGIAVSPWISSNSFTDINCVKGRFYTYRVKAAMDTAGLIQSDFSVADEGWAAGFSADFSYNGHCTGQTTSFKQTAAVHTNATYAWDFNNDGVIDSYGPETLFSFMQTGSFPVKLIITDANAFTDSITKNIVIDSLPLLMMVTDTIVCAGQSVTLDAGAGFSSYLWSTGAIGSSVTINSAANATGITAVMVQVSSGTGCAAIATTRVHWDTCTVAGGYNLAGIVTYDNNAATAMNNVNILLKQGEVVAAQTTTDNLGAYSFTNVPAGTYQLTGTSAKPWGGVNSIDALKVSKHFVGLSLLQGIRLKAADVNKSGGINSVDALQIAKRFVGLFSSFAAGDWAFPVDTVQVGGSANQTANMKALVYGDVDGSYSPPAKMTATVSLSLDGILVAEKSNRVNIPLKVVGAIEVGAISLILKIPDNISEIFNVESSLPGTLVFNTIADELRIAWYSLDPMMLNDGETLLTIGCRLTTDACNSMQTWTVDPMSQLANANAEVYADARLSMPASLVNTQEAFLGQNAPNPLSSQSQISWYMPEEGIVRLSVLDVLGNEVKQLTHEWYEAGSHTVLMSAGGLNPGTYSYRIEIIGGSIYFIQTKQMIILK